MDKKMAGLLDIKTSQKAKIPSKSRGGGQEYLDLYLTIKERERLKSYNSVIGKSMKQIQANLQEIERKIEDMGKSLLQKNGRSISRGIAKKNQIPKKPLKTMILDY